MNVCSKYKMKNTNSNNLQSKSGQKCGYFLFLAIFPGKKIQNWLSAFSLSGKSLGVLSHFYIVHCDTLPFVLFVVG